VDRGPCAYTITPDGTVELLGSPSRATGVRLDRSIRLAPAAAALDINCTLRNITTSNVSWGIWSIFQVKAGGLILLPAPEGTRVWEDPGSGALQHWKRHGDVLVLDHAGQEGKVMSTGPEGWIAREKDGEVLVMAFAAAPQAGYPAGEGCSEVYTSPRYSELEHVAPLATLGPGATTTDRVRWFLFSLDGARLTPEQLATRIRGIVGP
jgi:hypothetical protein